MMETTTTERPIPLVAPDTQQQQHHQQGEDDHVIASSPTSRPRSPTSIDVGVDPRHEPHRDEEHEQRDRIQQHQPHQEPHRYPQHGPEITSHSARTSAYLLDANHTTNPDSPDWKPSRQLWLILLGQICVVFIVALDSTILTLTLPTLACALDANAVKAFWIVASYLLASAVVQPLMAAWADIFGRRATFLASVGTFTLGTLTCSTASTIPQILAGRTVQGLGGGGIFAVNLIILSDIIPLRHRSRYVGIVQAVNSLAVNFGPLVGAGMLRHATWRWLFYINFPFCAVGLAAIPVLLRYVKAETTVVEKLGQVDWVGSGGFIAGATVFLIGISWGGNEFAWGSAATLVPIVMGVVVVGAALAWERWGARNPFLRLSLFGTRSQVVVYVCTVLQSLTLFTASYFLPLYYLTVLLLSPLSAGSLFLAYSFAVVPVSGLTGHLITTFASYKWALLTGWLTNTFGLGAFMLLSPTAYIPGIVFLSLVAGSGQGLLFMAHQVATQAGCKLGRDVGYASAMFSFARSFGFCLGIAIGGTVFQNLLRTRLEVLGLPAVIAAESEAFAAVLRTMPGSSERQEIVEAYAWAFRYLWAVMAGISGVGFALSFWIEEHTLDVELESAHRLRSTEVLARETGRAEKEDV